MTEFIEGQRPTPEKTFSVSVRIPRKTLEALILVVETENYRRGIEGGKPKEPITMGDIIRRATDDYTTKQFAEPGFDERAKIVTDRWKAIAPPPLENEPSSKDEDRKNAF